MLSFLVEKVELLLIGRFTTTLVHTL